MEWEPNDIMLNGTTETKVITEAVNSLDKVDWNIRDRPICHEVDDLPQYPRRFLEPHLTPDWETRLATSVIEPPKKPRKVEPMPISSYFQETPKPVKEKLSAAMSLSEIVSRLKDPLGIDCLRDFVQLKPVFEPVQSIPRGRRMQEQYERRNMHRRQLEMQQMQQMHSRYMRARQQAERSDGIGGSSKHGLQDPLSLGRDQPSLRHPRSLKDSQDLLAMSNHSANSVNFIKNPNLYKGFEPQMESSYGKSQRSKSYENDFISVPEQCASGSRSRRENEPNQMQGRQIQSRVIESPKVDSARGRKGRMHDSEYKFDLDKFNEEINNSSESKRKAYAKMIAQAPSLTLPTNVVSQEDMLRSRFLNDGDNMRVKDRRKNQIKGDVVVIKQEYD